jgi:hypothetical protein
VKKMIKHKSKVRNLTPLFKLGSSAWLNFVNLFSPKRGKLDPLFVGPFPILWQKGNFVSLSLPTRLSRVHPVFHVSLLRPDNVCGKGHHVTDPYPRTYFTTRKKTLGSHAATRLNEHSQYKQGKSLVSHAVTRLNGNSQ